MSPWSSIVELGGLVDGVRQAKGGVEVGAGGKESVVRPHDGVVGLHELARGLGDGGATRHHPGHHAHAGGEDHNALGHHLPEATGEVTVGERHDEAHLDDSGGMGVVDHAVGAVGARGGDAVVHVVAGELAGGLGAVEQAPHDAIGVALLVDLDDADVVRRVAFDVAHVLAAACSQEVGACQVLSRHAHLDPLARLGVEERTGRLDILFGHAVGEVAAVALVPALQPAVVAHAGKAAHEGQVLNRKAVDALLGSAQHAHCSLAH